MFPELANVNRDLFSMIGAWRRDPTLTVPVTPSAVFGVRFWHSFLLRSELLSRRHLPTGRPLSLFRQQEPTILIEFDGTLSGKGFRIFSLDPLGERLMAAGGLSCTFCLGGDSTYQNAMELAAVAVSLAACEALSLRNLAIRLRGDSVSVLRWTSGDNALINSIVARAPALVFTALCTHLYLVIDPAFIHISSEDNSVFDALSRGSRTPLDALDQSVTVFRDGDSLGEVLTACNPLLPPKSDAESLDRWLSMNPFGDDSINKF